MQVLTNTNIDFLGKRRIGFVLSLLVIGAGIVSLVVKGGPNLSIDFRGGQIVEVRAEPAIPLEDARAVLESADIGMQQVQDFGSPEELLVYLEGDLDLSAFLGLSDTDQFERWYEGTLDELCGRSSLPREPHWSRAFAVGSRSWLQKLTGDELEVADCVTPALGTAPDERDPTCVLAPPQSLYLSLWQRLNKGDFR